MRNFLNLNFKFISRSLVVAAIFFFSTSISHAQSAAVTFIKAEGRETEITINTGGRYQISWESTSAAICELTSNNPARWAVPPTGSILEEDDGSWFGISGNDELIYTITCFTRGTPVDRTTEYTTSNPFTETRANLSVGRTAGASSPKTVIVKVADQSETECDPQDEKCVSVCENYPGTSVCDACKADSSNANCLTQCTEPGNPVCSGDTDQINQTALPAKDDSTGCIPLVGTGFSFKKCTITVLDSTLVSLAASFLQLSAYIFEFSIQAGVVQFSSLVSDDTDWLTNIWSTIRDILNIAVIFVLLYSAIQVIVGRGGEIKKLIAGVILFGVLTNFSLFLTKAAVDVSNVIALEFYNQMRTTPLSETDFSGGLGATVVSITGLSNLYDPNPETGGISSSIEGGVNPLRESILFRLAMIFIFIAVAFVFLQATFVFVGRTISLILLMIFSPLMFAGGVFSPLQKWISKWHQEFLGQLTVAPLFMILLYVVLTIMGSLIRAVNTKLVGDDDLFSFLALIILTSALTIFGFGAALNKAKEFSGSIGGKTVQWGNKLTGFALSGALGGALSGTGSMLRGTIGKPMRDIGNWAENSNSYLGSGARLLRINKLKDTTLDVRNSKLAGKMGVGVSAALGAAGIDVSGVKPGAGSKTTVTTQIGPIKSVQKAFEERQKRSDKRALSTVEAKLKSIEEDSPKADETDASVIIEEKDAAGKMVKNKYTREGVPDDKEWAKKVKEANKQRGDKVIKEQNEYLDTLQVRSAWKGLGNRDVTSKDRSQKRKAMFRARKKALEKLEKGQKKAREIEKAKEGLKGYVDALKKYASDATPPGLIDIGLSTSEIGKLTNIELIDVYETAKGVAERRKATLDADLRRDGRGQLEINNAKDSIDAFIRMASKASTKVKSFEKTIKEKENSDEKDGRSKNKTK